MTIKENNQLVKQYGIYLPLQLNNLLHTQTAGITINQSNYVLYIVVI